MPQPSSREPVSHTGMACGLASYLLWGLMPLYYQFLVGIGSVTIVAHRVIWSFLLMAALILASGRVRIWRAIFARPRIALSLMASAALIAANWLCFIWAITTDHVLASSLGYFLNPLVNVLIGVAVFGERLDRWQAGAVAFAAAGVAILAVAAPGGLWVSLMLAVSFALYGMVRKLTPVAPMEGLATETLYMMPFALAYLGWISHGGSGVFGGTMTTAVLLIATGVATSAPLLLFAAAARRLRYSTLGVLQYVTPTLQFMLGVLVFGEPLTTRMLFCFALIWTGLVIFTVNALGTHRRIARAALVR